MIALLLILVSGVLLALGIVQDNTTLVWVALLLSGVAAASVLLVRLQPKLRGLTARQVAVSEDVDVESADAVEQIPTPEPDSSEDRSVVFIAGRTTFHDEGCALVVGKASSRALRTELEAGGMSACRRCL